MTYNEIVKSIMQGEKIYNLPLRVCYYSRVSTDSDVQLNSLENQLRYYENYIKSKDKWTYVGGYIEEGKTGVRVDVRTSFKKMINDAKLNKFDLIITKEVSRFARDLEDSIHYIRELKDSGVGIFFENQNLNTFDSNSELILNIMFNIAQDESKKLSSRIKFGHKQAINKGHVLGSSNITGYKKDCCKLVIVEEEAKFIKTLFELYATGEYGLQKLSKKLSTLGYLNKKGNLYDKDSLKRMIENPKYKGYYRANTYETIDYRTKKRKKNSKEEQILYKCENNIIPKIIDEELWDKANKILNQRTKSYKQNNCYSGSLKYPLSSKIYCKEHNKTFQRSHGNNKKDNPTWSCSKYIQHRLDACNSPIIKEIDLYNILSSIMNTLLPNNIIDIILNQYKNIDINKEYNKELNIINKELIHIENKKSLALDLVLNNDLDKNTLITQFKKYENKIKLLEQSKQNIIENINKNININYYSNLKISIENIVKENLLQDFIRTFIDEIIVSKKNNNRLNIILDIYINISNTQEEKTKGAKHINGHLTNEYLYLENKIYNSNKKKITYNVYISTL